MKLKKTIVSMLCIILSFSAGAFAVMAYEHRDFFEQNEVSENTLNRSGLTDEERQKMIDQRKQERADAADYTFEELMIKNGHPEVVEQYNKRMEELQSDEITRQMVEQNKRKSEEDEKEAVKVLESVERLVQKAGYYPEGVDRKELKRSEDYWLEFVQNACRAYSKYENELNGNEKDNILLYINNAYNEITVWYPQSNESMDTYELIEKTIEVRYPSTQVERR